MPCSPVQSLAVRGMLEILNGIFTKEIGFYTLLLVAILRHIRGVTDRDEIKSRSAASEKRAEFFKLKFNSFGVRQNTIPFIHSV